MLYLLEVDLFGMILEALDLKFGWFVVFLSELFLHKVPPVAQQHFSIAGWFRINGGSGN